MAEIYRRNSGNYVSQIPLHRGPNRWIDPDSRGWIHKPPPNDIVLWPKKKPEKESQDDE